MPRTTRRPSSTAAGRAAAKAPKKPRPPRASAEAVAQIRDRLAALERSVRWLARRTDTPPTTIFPYLSGQRRASALWVARANEVLGIGDHHRDLPDAAASAARKGTTSHVRTPRDTQRSKPQRPVESHAQQHAQQHAQRQPA